MENNSPILAPVVALLAWTMAMWLWMYVTRFPAISAAKLDGKGAVGWTGGFLDEKLPPSVQWKTHNYNHLMDEPTIFYAVALVLALIGQGDGFNLILAWVYVALRVAHSLVQAMWNRVLVRFALFALSSLILIALILHAAIVVF